MKSTRKMYRMYVHPERHKDIYEYMEGVESLMRGEILRSAVRLYIHIRRTQLVGSIEYPPELRAEAPAITQKLTDALPFG